MSNAPIRYNIQGLADELGVDIEDIAGLFTTYFAEMESEIGEMRKLLGRNDWDMIERIVHNIKGVSANLTIMDVYEEAQKFDTLLRSKQTDCASEYIEKIKSLIKNAEVEVKGFFKEKGFEI